MAVPTAYYLLYCFTQNVEEKPYPLLEKISGQVLLTASKYCQHVVYSAFVKCCSQLAEWRKINIGYRSSPTGHTRSRA